MYSPQKLLSDNTKTGCSINLPIKGHCRPTIRCARDCYGRTGHTALPTSQRKQSYVSKYLNRRNIDDLIKECRSRTAVRLSGAGDLKMSHTENILRLAQACPDTQFWGMTRKVDVARALNGKYNNLRLLVTVDPTSPASTWEYEGKLCFGPRHAGDEVPDDDRIVTVFPRHFAGQVVKGVPHHAKDCRAVWHEIDGCLSCGRCWNWQK